MRHFHLCMLRLMCTLRSLQCGKLREHITTVRTMLESKDNESAENIKKATNDLQQASLKLFEMAYKKVRDERVLLQILRKIRTIDNAHCL